jgi:hypothetical protein
MIAMNRILPLVFCLFIFSVGFAQRKPIERVVLDNLISETQFSNDKSEGLELVWYIPTEFWEVSFSREKYNNPEETKMIIDMLKDYTIVIAIKGKFGMLGGITYTPREEILNNLIVSYNGSKLKHLKQDELEPDLQNFITMLRPMLKNMMGKMGENMQVFVYKNDKKRPIDVWNKGSIEFKLFDFSPELNLPLGSLLEEKLCPEDQKMFNGKWSYCPFHGKELISKDN